MNEYRPSNGPLDQRPTPGGHRWPVRRIVVVPATALAVAGAILGGAWVAQGGPEVVPASVRTAKSDAASSPEGDGSRLLRPDGIGAVTMGMTLAEASEASGSPVEVDPDSLITDEAGCGHATIGGDSDGPSFMVVRESLAADWIIVRTDITESSDVTTVDGVGLGDNEGDVKAAYPDLTVEPNLYAGPEGQNLVVDGDGPNGYLTIFETDGETVTSFRSGNEDAVRAPEGCA